jgi:hypothetical protein
MQEASLRQPTTALDQFLVEDSNLTRWTAKADEA